MIFIVLPAYNEEQTLASLLKAIIFNMKENRLSYKVVVVNDGSTDTTAQTIDKFKRRMPLFALHQSRNRGLSESLKNGLLYAVKKANNNDIIITMDSDNTHTPGLILQMVRLIREGHDVVIASRYKLGARIKGVPYKRRVLSRTASVVFRLLFPLQGVKDYTSGYRAYKSEILKRAFSHYGKDFVNRPGFSCMVDILLKLRHLDVIATEVPLILRYDFKKGKSKMNVVKTITETLSLLVESINLQV